MKFLELLQSCNNDDVKEIDNDNKIKLKSFNHKIKIIARTADENNSLDPEMLFIKKFEQFLEIS